MLDVDEFELTQHFEFDIENHVVEPIMRKLDHIKNRAVDYMRYETSK